MQPHDLITSAVGRYKPDALGTAATSAARADEAEATDRLNTARASLRARETDEVSLLAKESELRGKIASLDAEVGAMNLDVLLSGLESPAGSKSIRQHTVHYEMLQAQKRTLQLALDHLVTRRVSGAHADVLAARAALSHREREWYSAAGTLRALEMFLKAQPILNIRGASLSFGPDSDLVMFCERIETSTVEADKATQKVREFRSQRKITSND